MLKIQNTTQITFKFEGTIIEPNETKEIDDLVGQRLLALWWHRGLELIEETTPAPTFPPVQENAEVVKEEVKAETSTFPCDKCSSVFTSARGLSAHKKFSKTCK